ncbi:D-glycero-beta-D-manno-heptose 1-phosphate adenylyltransferase [Flavisolibacter ginsenosidimutans]|uniref:D-glycero-beta-D-manno-heptose 1-phosphate adenylyltransferase n=1 Tax=Flavisolibacter ginsenosidimutans TaxID=661481 RepID=A0A5B8UF83_9BACT|nr:D-glycero-beta-D-manno-heptose 1-phosphate adenylyltransferase [Flavisolibacter ginsenosidimutans]QEC54966.1 D-glycero-beta-D-manno-heptose 1-phosphate adenylyltransferase [Flavisolibacter ginsenosidimutans]
MKEEQNLQTKISHLSDLQQKVTQWKSEGKTVAFTNGCFDILHAGHIASLQEAAQQGDKLIVALNADSSVKALKGESRPVNNENARAVVVAALGMVDAVVVFSEPTPKELIIALKPDVLVKGGDYKVEDIAGAKEVLNWGGKVIINPIVEGYSTTLIIEKMRT